MRGRSEAMSVDHTAAHQLEDTLKAELSLGREQVPTTACLTCKAKVRSKQSLRPGGNMAKYDILRDPAKKLLG